MLYLTFFFTITLLIYSIFVFQEERKKRIKRRLASFGAAEKEEIHTEAAEKKEISLFKRIFYPLLREFKRSFKKRMPGEKEARIEVKLLQAGRPFNMTPVDYRLLQISLILLLPILSWLYAFFLNFGLGAIIIFVLFSMMASLFLPNFYLKQKIKKRSSKALKELPDVLDLLTVSLEAGLGFDSALSKLVSKKHGVLSSEFQRCLEEIRLGKTRREALSGVRERLALDECRTLISSILQAEKLGIGMVQVLRVQSEEARDQRKQRAEEAAMKAPIKMLFPLILFIFPCIFIILLGPVVIQFIEVFSK
jgi:tight adherence protein C